VLYKLLAESDKIALLKAKAQYTLQKIKGLCEDNLVENSIDFLILRLYN